MQIVLTALYNVIILNRKQGLKNIILTNLSKPGIWWPDTFSP